MSTLQDDIVNQWYHLKLDSTDSTQIFPQGLHDPTGSRAIGLLGGWNACATWHGCRFTMNLKDMIFTHLYTQKMKNKSQLHSSYKLAHEFRFFFAVIFASTRWDIINSKFAPRLQRGRTRKVRGRHAFAEVSRKVRYKVYGLTPQSFHEQKRS